MPTMTRQGQVIYYNGYDNFGPFTKVERMDCRPEKDMTGRTTVGNRYSLTLKTVVTGATAKTESERMRKALSKNGGKLIVTGLASGDIRVNDGVKKDIAYGPWVEILSFDPTFGGELATTLVWTITWVLPECDDAKYRGRVSEFSYTIAYSQDEASYSTRVIDLRLKIPQNFLLDGTGRLQDNPEDYVLDVLPVEIPGCRRKFGTRTISEDRSEIRWQITDEQIIGQAPFPGIIDETGSYSVSSDNSMGNTWNGTINYSCELPPNGTFAKAVRAMTSFVSARTRQLARLKGRDGRPATLILVGYSFSEPECLGRKKFDFSITFSVTTTLAELLSNSGIWTPAPGRDWKAWSTSLQDTALNPRGFFEFQFDAGQDRVTSLCNATPPKIFRQGFRVRPGINDIFGELGFPPTKPETSWRNYKNAIYIEQESSVVGTRTLPAIQLTESTLRSGSAIANGLFPFGNGSNVSGGGIGGGPPTGLPPGLIPGNNLVNVPIEPEGNNTAVRVARPMQWVIMVGEAVRIGFPIPEPTLETVNGVRVLRSDRNDAGEGFKQWVDFHNGIQPFYKAKWKLRFMPVSDLPDMPLPPAPNPIMPAT